jgi:hypothetical protein
VEILLLHCVEVRELQAAAGFKERRVEKARGGAVGRRRLGRRGSGGWEALQAPEVERRRTGSKTFQVPAAALPSWVV